VAFLPVYHYHCLGKTSDYHWQPEEPCSTHSSQPSPATCPFPFFTPTTFYKPLQHFLFLMTLCLATYREQVSANHIADALDVGCVADVDVCSAERTRIPGGGGVGRAVRPHTAYLRRANSPLVPSFKTPAAHCARTPQSVDSADIVRCALLLPRKRRLLHLPYLHNLRAAATCLPMRLPCGAPAIACLPTCASGTLLRLPTQALTCACTPCATAPSPRRNSRPLSTS